MSLVPLFGPVGPELLIILLVLVLLFGANKIPRLARSTGEAMGEFKKGREDIEEELEQAAQGSTTDTTSGGGGSESQGQTDTTAETTADTESDKQSQGEPTTDGGVHVPEKPSALKETDE